MEKRQGSICQIQYVLCVISLTVASQTWAQEANNDHEDRDRGEELSRGREWHLGIEAVTDFPVSVGGQFSLELPYGFRINTSFGVLPSAYLDTVNSVIVAAGGYNETTASLVSEALRSSFVWRIHAGWRPFRNHGFYLEAGYGMITLGGCLSSGEVITAVTGQSLPAGVPDNFLEFGIDSMIHMVDIEVGWEFVFIEHLVLRFAIGAALTVGAKTEITPGESIQNQPLIQEYSSQAASIIDDVYREYIFSPTFSVALGYRFF